MSETSRISITDSKVRKRVASVMQAYRTKAAHEKARKAFLRGDLGPNESKEAKKPRHRMYMKPDDYLYAHGKKGVNIIK